MIVTSGSSDAAKILEQQQRSIYSRCNFAVTLSRQDALNSICDAWQATEARCGISDDEAAITSEVRDAAVRFVESLPLGFPQPAISAEPDGHINLEWYRNPRRVISVSVGPADRLHWAALIGSESPRGSVRFIDRVPESILQYIARVFQG
ncbi:MAG TPA: hypothetical protein PLY87_29515 [Planctomycetaceae bacterium]|nr:hypothetical protein [Planctomycetaceae bacterium]HQZ69275.1 hypothetical protein [Planctomycetaceae bacterium]